MSKRVDATMPCVCGRQFPVSIYRSLWVEYPENMQMVMEESVNVFHCPYCGQVMQVANAFLCTNVQKNYAVWYDPEHEESVDEELAAYAQMFGPNNYYADAPRASSYQELKSILRKFESGELKGIPPDKSKVLERMGIMRVAPPVAPRESTEGIGQKIGRFFQKLFDNKPEKPAYPSAPFTSPPPSKRPVKTTQKLTTTTNTPVDLVWQRDANNEPTGTAMKFDASGQGTIIAGKTPNASGPMFCLGAMIRRMLEPTDALLAAKWAGCQSDNKGQPLWSITEEQYFAEAFIEYSALTDESGSLPTGLAPPPGLNRPPLTPELRTLFKKYQG